MKHIKVILTLSIVVLTASVMVFFVEAWSTPIINDYNIEQSNLAKFEVLPTIVSSELVKDDGVTPIDPETYDYGTSSIIELLMIPTKGYIYTAEFSGYQSVVRYMLAFNMDGDITGFKVLFHGETPGYGDSIADEDFRVQFETLSQEDAIAGNIDALSGASGAPVTSGAFKVSLAGLVEFHQATFEGVVVETPEEREARLLLVAFPTAVRYEDVTANYEASDDIEVINEAYDSGDVLLGYVYYVNTVGANYTNPSTIEFFVGFNLDKEITGFALLADTETAGKTTDMYNDDFGDAFIGDDLESDDYGIDDIAGSTDSNVSIHEAVKVIAEYHLEFVLLEGVVVRPDDVVVSDEDLKLAFPEGITFTSVYQDYTYNEVIGNVYEVYDAGSVLLGTVYYVDFDGRDNSIQLVLGIDLAGNTKLIEILYSEESWQGADEFGDYDGLSGYFPDTVWLDFFEGVSVLDLILDPVDTIAGVSTTTGRMIVAIEEVLQYHLFELVGGAN